jgi:predicted PurR-regulated permease PerM
MKLSKQVLDSPTSVVAVSMVILTAFFYFAPLFLSPLVLGAIVIFLLYPYRNTSVLIKRILVSTTILYITWIFFELNFSLVPFIVSFIGAYLLEPIVVRLGKKGLPRVIAATIVVLTIVAVVTIVSIYFFPILFQQLDQVVRQIREWFTVHSLNDQQQFFDFLTSLGIPEQDSRAFINEHIVPKLETILQSFLYAILNVITSITTIAGHLINIILVPVLLFYFIKDMQYFQDGFHKLAMRIRPSSLPVLQSIHSIINSYISWQILAAIIVSTVCSISFSLMGVPYGFVLGALCGLLNPIPTIGLIICIVLSILTVILVNPPNLLSSILTIIITINAIHFINSYFIEPKILGEKVGLNPIILFASLFVFGHFFGIIGLIIAIPTTAIILLFYKEWMKFNEPIIEEGVNETTL